MLAISKSFLVERKNKIKDIKGVVVFTVDFR